VTNERRTMRGIREAIKNGRLKEPFRAADVNRALSIGYAGTFLPKHRIGNPGFKGKPFTAHFVQLERGLYRLRKSN